MEDKFIRVRSIKDIVISSILTITGTVLVIIPSSDPLNILGFFTIVTGLLLAFILKTAYKHKDNGEKFQKKEIFYGNEMRDRLKSALTSPMDFRHTQESQGSTLRMDVYYNKTKAYMQLLEYIPYRYEPCSAVHEHSFDKVSNLIK